MDDPSYEDDPSPSDDEASSDAAGSAAGCGLWAGAGALVAVAVVVVVVAVQANLFTAHHSPTTSAGGQATVVFDQDSIAALGLHFGPDSAVTGLVDRSGHVYAYFTGNPSPSVANGFQLYRFASDATLSHLTPAPSHAVLEPGDAGDVSPVPWCSPQTCFDQTYAGGGSVLQCPGGGPLLVAYHGEEATDPDGDRNGTQGWSGIGVAAWNPATSRFTKVDQAIGLAASNIWRQSRSGARTDQTAPASYQGSLVDDPATGQVRLYYGDVAPATAPNATPQTRVAVAAIDRTTLCADAVAGRHAPWKKWYEGAFSQPGVHTADQPGGRAGSGGRFTPLDVAPGATSPSVVRTTKGWYMVTTEGHAAVTLATSSDGITWTRPTTVYTTASGQIRYASLWLTGSNQAQVTFTWNAHISGWRGDFALERFGLTLP